MKSTFHGFETRLVGEGRGCRCRQPTHPPTQNHFGFEALPDYTWTQSRNKLTKSNSAEVCMCVCVRACVLHPPSGLPPPCAAHHCPLPLRGWTTCTSAVAPPLCCSPPPPRSSSTGDLYFVCFSLRLVVDLIPCRLEDPPLPPRSVFQLNVQIVNNTAVALFYFPPSLSVHVCLEEQRSPKAVKCLKRNNLIPSKYSGGFHQILLIVGRRRRRAGCVPSVSFVLLETALILASLELSLFFSF